MTNNSVPRASESSGSEVPQHIIDMIEHSEKIRVDYKESLPENDRSAREDLMAFANACGGHILYGVKEEILKDGSQRGVLQGFKSDNIDVVKRRVENWARDLRPNVSLGTVQEYALENRRWLLVVEVKEQAEKPVGMQNGVYKIRTHTGNQPMDQAAMRTAVLSEERQLRSLQASLQQNIDRAKIMLDSLNQRKIPITVFEIIDYTVAMGGPELSAKLGKERLAGEHQNRRIVERMLDVAAILSGVQSSPNAPVVSQVRGLIQTHGTLLIQHTGDLLDRVGQCLRELEDKRRAA